jgi:hypothetical protein
MRERAEELRKLGYTVQARWINGGHGISYDAITPLDRQRFAEEDLEDLATCDCIISFTEMPGTAVRGGGRHFEAGYAFCAGIRNIVVGYREHVFHNLEDIEFYPTWEECLAELAREADAIRNGDLEEAKRWAPTL